MDAPPDARNTPLHDDHRRFALTLGLDRLGLATLWAPWLAGLVIVGLTVAAVLGIQRLKVDDSLAELFRTNTEEFRRFEEIDRRFPASEYDVLLVVEAPDLLAKPQLEAFRRAIVELQLADGVNGLVSMLSARGKPDTSGYAPPIVPDALPDGADYDRVIKALRENEIVAGKFLSADGTLALAVLSLERGAVQDQGAKAIIGGIRAIVDKETRGSGLTTKLTGAPVMQLEIRNAVERDQLVYNGAGLLFGAGLALFFFRNLALMLLAALPPVLAVVWSLGLLGWLGFKLNLFLNVMTPLVMVMGFADSMQVVSAVRIRLREGDTPREALRFAVRVVGPACVLAHACALVSFVALLTSDSGMIHTFGVAGGLATLVSYFAVLGALPVLGLLLLRWPHGLTREANPSDRAMEAVGAGVGWIVDRVVHRPWIYAIGGLALLALFGAEHMKLQPRYRLADQVPDREQALDATGRLDRKLTGSNPVHVMIEWKDARDLYSAGVIDAISATHKMIESEIGLGNVWSLDSLRRWLREAGDDRIETVKTYVGFLPDHLVRRFIAKDGRAVLVTGRLPDIDASQILPVVEKLDRALESVRKASPGMTISVTGLPAIAARNSAGMIKQLNHAMIVQAVLVAALLGLAFRSWFVTVISLLPGLFPVFAAGALLSVTGQGLEFASIIALIVIFGLAVDALIHFLNRLRREERAGEDPLLAIRRARVLVGPAIILTTIVLAVGLGVTVFSDLPSLRLFGMVCGVTLIVSLVADLVFLPATVAIYRRLRPVT